MAQFHMFEHVRREVAPKCIQIFLLFNILKKEKKKKIKRKRFGKISENLKKMNNLQLRSKGNWDKFFFKTPF